MIPDTAGALLAFLALVAPGIAYYLVRDLYTPGREMSAFRETSVVALTSIVFTVAATMALTGLAATPAGGFLPDLGAWTARGNAYFQEHVAAGLLGLTAEVALACLLAAGTAWLYYRGRPHGRLRDVGTWFQIFRVDRPDGATPWLRVELDDDTVVRGYLKHYSTAESPDDRELTLVGPSLSRLGKGEPEERLEGWYSVLVPGSKIRMMAIAYVDDTTGATRPARGSTRIEQSSADGDGNKPAQNETPAEKETSTVG